MATPVGQQLFRSSFAFSRGGENNGFRVGWGRRSIERPGREEFPFIDFWLSNPITVVTNTKSLTDTVGGASGGLLTHPGMAGGMRG